MLKQFANKKLVEHHGFDYGILILPVLSLSKPSPDPRFGGIPTQRLVFDWGKSLSHPNAHVAFGMLTRPQGHYFERLIIGDNQYAIVGSISTCRSGRKAAIIVKESQASPFNMELINKALAQEFPSK